MTSPIIATATLSLEAAQAAGAGTAGSIPVSALAAVSSREPP
jgi:hypothetical protein